MISTCLHGAKRKEEGGSAPCDWVFNIDQPPFKLGRTIATFQYLSSIFFDQGSWERGQGRDEKRFCLEFLILCLVSTYIHMYREVIGEIFNIDVHVVQSLDSEIMEVEY